MKTDTLHRITHQLGIRLDKKQPNIGGERALMSPNKLVLLGQHIDTDERVVLKCAEHPAGAAEIKEEWFMRHKLTQLPFAEEELLLPNELFYGHVAGATASVTSFIPQERVFTDHSIEEQFFMAIYALEAQEAFHATTLENQKSVRNIFPIYTPKWYQESLLQMQYKINQLWPQSSQAIIYLVQQFYDNIHLLHLYNRYLVHTDFVPHNFRIHERRLYLLDLVSFRLGNKYESWSRFINFMQVHSPELVPLLTGYIIKNRGDEEAKVLQLLRSYKVTYLLHYYSSILEKTDGNLRILTLERLKLWTHILEATITDSSVSSTVLTRYYARRDELRTISEKERQRQFTWV